MIDEHLSVAAYRSHVNKWEIPETEKDKATQAEDSGNFEDDDEGGKDSSPKSVELAVSNKDRLTLNATEFNARFKDIVVTTGVEYTDVLNYTLMRIGSKTETLLKDFDNEFKLLSLAEEQTDEVGKQKRRKERMLVGYLQELIDVIFFIYARSKKVNTTLKAIIALNVILDYVKSDYQYPKKAERMSKEARDVVMKKLRDEISLLFQTSEFNEYTQLEILYFLLVLKKMGAQYYIPKRVLNRYLLNSSEDGVVFKGLNMLSVFMLLYYWGDGKVYGVEKKALLEYVEEKFDNTPIRQRRPDTELMMLVIELSSCPFVPQETKHHYLEHMGIVNKQERLKIIHYLKRNGFCVRWTGVDLTKELGAKISQEVYS